MLATPPLFIAALLNKSLCVQMVYLNTLEPNMHLFKEPVCATTWWATTHIHATCHFSYSYNFDGTFITLKIMFCTIFRARAHHNAQQSASVLCNVLCHTVNVCGCKWQWIAKQHIHRSDITLGILTKCITLIILLQWHLKVCEQY